MRREEFAHRPTARLVAAAVLLAAVVMLAGCITQIMPAWNVTAIMWRATGDPIADVNDNWHYPAEGHVWQFVWLRMENMTGRPRAIDLARDLFTLYKGKRMYEPEQGFTVPFALPMQYAPRQTQEGCLVFQVPYPDPAKGGVIAVNMADGPVVVYSLTDSMQEY